MRQHERWRAMREALPKVWAKLERSGRRGWTPVRAAGGVVFRESHGGKQVLLVHRPAYDDWSLPKGKAHDGESDEDCARREVEEETGLRCELGRELPSTRYRDGRGRPKVVRYWAMDAGKAEARAKAEVDEVVWLPLEEAKRRLTWARDRIVLDAVGCPT